MSKVSSIGSFARYFIPIIAGFGMYISMFTNPLQAIPWFLLGLAARKGLSGKALIGLGVGVGIFEVVVYILSLMGMDLNLNLGGMSDIFGQMPSLGISVLLNIFSNLGVGLGIAIYDLLNVGNKIKNNVVKKAVSHLTLIQGIIGAIHFGYFMLRTDMAFFASDLMTLMKVMTLNNIS